MHHHPVQATIGWLAVAVSIPLLWRAQYPGSQTSVDPAFFIFFHTTVELSSIVISGLVFVTGFSAMMSSRKGAVVFLGVAFLGVALLDLLHTMSYVGMPQAITPNTPQKSIFFWLCARMLAALALFAYAFLPTVPDVSNFRKELSVALVCVCVAVLGAVGLSIPDSLLPLFVIGQGLTPLKLGLEWLVIGINMVALVLFWKRRQELANECILALGFAVALSIVSELFFTMLGAADQNFANVVGHFYKLAAYSFLLHATFNEALRRPLDRMAIQGIREKQVLSAAPDGILLVNERGEILMVNPSMEAICGYGQDELLGRNVDLFLPEDLRARHGESMRSFFTFPHSRAMGAMDLNLMRKDGHLLPVDISLGVWDDHTERHAIAYVRDISERKGFEASLRHRATHDDLTGLPNRWYYRLQLEQALSHGKRSSRKVATLFIDLDNFKSVNDSYGHAVGDQLLVQVARRLRGVLREEDTLARMGGDEFAILISDMEDANEAIKVAEKLLSVMEGPYTLHSHDVLAGGSIGISFYPDDTANSEHLLRYADMAMYQAKQMGRGGYACYSAKLENSAREKLQLHSLLKEAIEQGKLKLLYQPQVDINTSRIVGVEALLRWFDPVLGEISPARFIPVAESTGLILPLSDWVLSTACNQIADWERQGSPLRIAVNFSAQQFQKGDLQDKVRASLMHAGATPRYLEVEVTESIAMAQPELARQQLQAIVDMGCTVALDDFGTGYSSLAYLKALPVAVIKIDRGFIKDLPNGPNDAKITKSIIALAHSLDLTLVAEGVETAEQLAFLKEHGCESYQGWFFAKAMDAVSISRLTQEASSFVGLCK